jgi:hypothetical protein
MGTENERLEDMRKYNEERAQLQEKPARGGVGKEILGLACMAVQSDYDLRPR